LTGRLTSDPVATRVTLRPVASSLPLGFLALAVATIPFTAVQLGWVPATAKLVPATVMALGRRGDALAGVQGEAPLAARDLAGEPGVRPQL
jgi:hypothetical protein